MAVQEREIREIKLRKRFNATQHGSARKRNQRNKVDEEAECSRARQCKKEKSKKESLRRGSTDRSAAVQER